MAKKLNTILFICFISLISLYARCTKESIGCANTVYTFETGVKVYPDKSDFNVGDTLWLDLNIPTSETDIGTGKIIDYSGAANLGTTIGFSKIVTKDSFVTAANFFDYLVISGKLVPNQNVAQIREFNFAEQTARYIFRIGIIPKQKGVFGLGISNAANVYRSSDYCTKASFLISIVHSQQHFYLNPVLNTSNFDSTKSNGSFYFKVN